MKQVLRRDKREGGERERRREEEWGKQVREREGETEL